MFTKVIDGFEWMTSFTNLEKKPDPTKRAYRLDRMYALLDLFNNPQNMVKLIHVAGSKGKGSTATFIASILSEYGYKTGIYTSPHLLDYRERITLNHSFFSDESYLNAVNKIKHKLDIINPSSLPGGQPTTFELLTLCCFIIFKDQSCDWAVIETGIGGTLDSTNVILPEASAITPIELEHCDILGNTIEEIASQKAGIIKPLKPVFTSNYKPEVLSIIKNTAIKNNSNCFISGSNISCTVGKEGTILNVNNKIYKLGINGKVQGQNALLAIDVVKYLLTDIKDIHIKNGLFRAFIPGRFQIVNNIVLDGAHTKESITDTVNTFKAIFSRGVIIFGAIKGKNINDMAEVICKTFTNIIISTPGTFKETDIEEVTQVFNKKANPIKIKDPREALELAKTYNMPILVTGSFYMAGEIAKIIL